MTGKSSSTMQARARVMQVITASHASSLNRHHESAYFAGGNLHYRLRQKKQNNSLEKSRTCKLAEYIFMKLKQLRPNNDGISHIFSEFQTSFDFASELKCAINSNLLQVSIRTN